MLGFWELHGFGLEVIHIFIASPSSRLRKNDFDKFAQVLTILSPQLLFSDQTRNTHCQNVGYKPISTSDQIVALRLKYITLFKYFNKKRVNNNYQLLP